MAEIKCIARWARWVRLLILPAAALLVLSAALAADEPPPPPPPPWQDTAELGFVATAGNSETSTLGFKNTLLRNWERAVFALRAGAVRAESTTDFYAIVGIDKTGDGIADVYRLYKDSLNTTNAENYYINGQYDRKITDRFVWFAGAGWDRNEPAGIKNRYYGVGGVGNIWVDEETIKFKTNYGLTYTKQDDVIPDPAVEDSFFGARFTWDYLHKFGASTAYANIFVVDENLDKTSDFRADMTNSVAVAMSKRMALKASLQFLYDNEPSLSGLPDEIDPADGTITRYEYLDELDTIFTVSLVLSF